MPFFTTPTSFRNANPGASYSNLGYSPPVDVSSYRLFHQTPMSPAQQSALPPHSSHPDFGHLTLLVFEAVLEVVCVSLPGYIVARRGLFSEEMQKFIAYLNILLFTPCLSLSSILGNLLQADTGGSLHQTGFSIVCRQTGRSCGNTCNICSSSRNILSLFYFRRKSIRIQEQSTQLCDCHGCMCTTPSHTFVPRHES